uniref:uncharacterized protein LOC117601278 isoform X2 n=1 Tax=Osmia lignaria TaxID=473952 RepID=UPI0014798001|nr:uncharacterized protein LOC117601278 isoform X2 [Osmia lignaria]
MLPSSKLLQEEPATESTAASTSRDPSSVPITLPNTPVDHATDDDPPPYSDIVPPNHIGWTYDFSAIPYSACTSTPCRQTEVPLASFQTSGSCFHPEGTDSQHTSIPMPLMSCRLFMFGSHRSLFSHSNLPFSDNISISKDSQGKTRRATRQLAIIIFSSDWKEKACLFCDSQSVVESFVLGNRFTQDEDNG